MCTFLFSQISILKLFSLDKSLYGTNMGSFVLEIKA